jgi:hypothetical protein
MHLKVFVKLKKTLKTLSSGQKTQKKKKKTQETQKKQKNPKKPTGLVFFKKTRVFSNPGLHNSKKCILWLSRESRAKKTKCV